MANEILLNIDTTKSEFQNPMVQLRQGDGNYQSLSVTVTSNGEPFDLTGWTITFMGTTAGGFKIVDTASVVTNVSQGAFTYTPNKAWGQDIGEFDKAYFKFTNGDEAASGANFRVKVFEAVDLTDEEAGDYISVVDVMIDKIKTDMDNKLADTQKTLSDTQSQATTVQGNVNKLNTNVNELKAQNNAIKTTDNTWTGTNTFNNKIISPAGIKGPIDNTELINTPAFQSLKTQVDNSNNTYVKDTRLASGITDFDLVIGKTWSGKWYKSGAHWSNEPAGASNYLQFEYSPGDNDISGILEIRDWVTNRYWMRAVSGRTWSNWVELANDATAVHKTGTETVSGDKTFTGNIIASNPIQGVLGYPKPAITNLDNLISTNQYKIDSSFTGTPPGMPNGAFLFVFSYDGYIVYQTIIARQISSPNTQATMWTRIKSASWGDWRSLSQDETVVHNSGTETVSGDKTFTGNINFTGQTTLKTGKYGLRVTTAGVQKTSDGGTTWVNI